jgi:pyruvate carboxylase
MKLLKDTDPNKCVLQVTQEEQNALVTATSDDAHQELLGSDVLSHLKKHHNYGSQDPEKPTINLRHEIVADE